MRDSLPSTSSTKAFYGTIVPLVENMRLHAALLSAISRFLSERFQSVAVAGSRIDFASFFASKGQGNPPTKTPRGASDNAYFAHFFSCNPIA